MRKIPLLCCAAVARVCKQRLREGFQTKRVSRGQHHYIRNVFANIVERFRKAAHRKTLCIGIEFFGTVVFFVTKGKEEPFRGIATAHERARLERQQ